MRNSLTRRLEVPRLSLRNSSLSLGAKISLVVLIIIFLAALLAPALASAFTAHERSQLPQVRRA